MAQGRDLHQGLTANGLEMNQNRSNHLDERISVRVDQILPWLANAATNGFAWLRDFEDEEICITTDLHDVILAYQHFHQK